jgi:hypothetical protein
MMQNALPMVQQTPAGPIFFADMLMKMFPDTGAKYVKILNEAAAQQQSAQAQQQQKMIQTAMSVGKQIVELSKRPEMFSDTGKVHVMPIVEQVAQQIEAVMPQQEGGSQ